MKDPLRLLTIAALVPLLVVGLYHRILSGRTREPLDRRQEGLPLLVGIRLLGLAGLMQIVWFLSDPAKPAWARLTLPIGLRWAGLGLLTVSVGWLCWMFASLGRNLTDTVVTRRESTLVVRGPYRYVRNPMYIGLAVLGLGFGVAMGNWPVPVTTMAVFVLLAVRTKTEEEFLIARFGDSYRHYMKRTNRFLPGI